MSHKINLNKGSMRERIIDLISEEPLTAKQLHAKLQRQFSILSSYQATHKILSKLVEDNILKKIDRKYTISEAWISHMENKTKNLKTKLSEPKINLEEVKNKESVNLTFKGIPAVGWFLVDTFMKAPNPEKKHGLALWRFCYSLIGLEEKHYIGIKERFKENEWHAIVEENNSVDKMFGETLKEYGLKSIKFGVNCATPLSDKMILGDYICEIIYPANFRKLWAIQNRMPKKLIEFNIGKHLMNMRELQPEIQAIVTKNEKMAEEYREEYLFFK